MLQNFTPEESRQFREFLQESGYNIDVLRQRFGHSDIPQGHLLKLYLLGVPLEPNRLNTLCRWFWIGIPVEEPVAGEFIPKHMLDLFLERGLLVKEDGAFVSRVRISPFRQFLIASDHAMPKTGELRNDTVLWPNPTSRMCHNLSMQAPVGRTLDLGTGNGVLAIAAASHSTTVVATDINPRAREFFEFNAALNGVSNVEYREGNSFEPVRGERFDLILANPPFFVTPSMRRVYSDNSMELDGFCRSLIRQAPEYLTENGYCQMLVEWVQVKGQPWRERITEWVSGIGCDAWVMAGYTRSGADYAMVRVQEDRIDPGGQAAIISSWQAYFERNEVEAIFGGMIVLRRRSGPNWIRIEELQAEPVRPFGDFLRRIFDCRDYLSNRSDEELLSARPALPASAALRKDFVISPEGWKLKSVELRVSEGLAYSMALQPQVADFVALWDGKRTLGEIADETAASVGVDPSVVRQESCRIVRQVADRGMVLF